jgi:hypothetical protein
LYKACNRLLIGRFGAAAPKPVGTTAHCIAVGIGVMEWSRRRRKEESEEKRICIYLFEKLKTQ